MVAGHTIWHISTWAVRLFSHLHHIVNTNGFFPYTYFQIAKVKSFPEVWLFHNSPEYSLSYWSLSARCLHLFLIVSAHQLTGLLLVFEVLPTMAWWASPTTHVEKLVAVHRLFVSSRALISITPLLHVFKPEGCQNINIPGAHLDLMTAFEIPSSLEAMPVNNVAYMESDEGS
jgi:hypothetical protein